MIKAKGGEVTFRGTRSNVIAEAVTVYVRLKRNFQRKSTNGN